jgi:PKD repeat protein
VIVHPKPTSIFTFSPDSACGAPVVVQFNNQSILGSGANWSFTDGQTSTQISPAMNFTQVGTIGAQLIAISDFGCKDISSDQFVVYPEPIADIAVVDPSGCEDFTPIFINNSTNAVSYLWTFGDGFVSTDQTPKHTYVNDGNYQVSLVIEGVGGCRDSAALNNQIVVLPGPTAGFTYTQSSNPTYYWQVFFNNTSVNEVLWHWSFGDGDTTDIENPTHQYKANGIYNVELVVTSSNGCTDTARESIELNYFGNLYVPNAFAPELGGAGDMYNVFYPQGVGLKSYHVEVYDMFGILIWESTALDNGSPSEWWDGTRNGVPLPMDVYIWKIDAEFQNGDIWEGQKSFPILDKDDKRKSDGSSGSLPRRTGNVTLVR